MDQRKLMDNANTITDMAKVYEILIFLKELMVVKIYCRSQTQNTVYEIVSDMNTRQDALEQRLGSLEDQLVNVEEKLTSLQNHLEILPEELTRCLAQHAERMEQRRNFLHPDMAVALASTGGGGGGGGLPMGTSFSIGGSSNVSAHHPLACNLSSSPLLPHSRSVPSAPSTTSLHPWPVSPVIPPVSSRTPHLVPDTGSTRHHSLVHSNLTTGPITSSATTSQSVTRLTSQSGMGGLGNSQGSDTSAHS